MSRTGIGTVLAAVAALALALPVAARNNNAGKTSKSTASATVEILSDANLGGTQLKAGTYNVKADETKVTLSRNGKVVAEAPVQWKEDAAKSQGSSMVVEAGTVKEIHFNGKTRYAELSSSAGASNGGQR
ncbi:MAG TPA: hypothetical protein VLY23_09700 [Candidatus Acidoferrum sp.]|nr:hypothetical protein [Candidatus Acidoferrum sp.]